MSAKQPMLTNLIEKSLKHILQWKKLDDGNLLENAEFERMVRLELKLLTDAVDIPDIRGNGVMPKEWNLEKLLECVQPNDYAVRKAIKAIESSASSFKFSETPYRAGTDITLRIIADCFADEIHALIGKFVAVSLPADATFEQCDKLTAEFKKIAFSERVQESPCQQRQDTIAIIRIVDGRTSVEVVPKTREVSHFIA